jgi:hypothetical protein
MWASRHPLLRPVARQLSGRSMQLSKEFTKKSYPIENHTPSPFNTLLSSSGGLPRDLGPLPLWRGINCPLYCVGAAQQERTSGPDKDYGKGQRILDLKTRSGTNIWLLVHGIPVWESFRLTD